MFEEVRDEVEKLDYERSYKPGNDLLNGFAGEVKWEDAPWKQRESCCRYANQIHGLYAQAFVDMLGKRADEHTESGDTRGNIDYELRKLANEITKQTEV